MGLLTSLFGLTPEQTQGLLGFSGALAQSSGPSLMPTSGAQGLAAALQGYQQGVNSYQDRQQQQTLAGLKIRGLQGEIADQEKARQDALDAKNWLLKYNLGGQADATAAARSVLGNGMSPTMANAAKLSAATPAPASTSNATMDFFNQRVQQAQAMRASGIPQLIAQADKLEETALKFKPKYDTKPQVVLGPDGKPMLVQIADDGTVRPIQGGYGNAEKLDFRDTGSAVVGFDPYTGKAVSTAKKSVSPDAAAANQLGYANLNLSRQRFNFDQTNANKPVFNAEAGGWVLPPSDDNPAGKLLPVAGISGKAPTEFQGKSAAFGLRAAAADKILQGLEGKYSPSAINSKNSLGSVWGIGGALGAAANSLLDENSQLAEQAQRDFLNANLRQESGAAIADSEFDNGKKQYFPQPGDSPAVIAQKAANRQRVIQGFDANAGRAKIMPAAPAASGQTTSPAPEKFDMLPAASGFAGKRMRADNGTIYRSNGTKWIKE